jgi:hypothetical protein
MAHILWPKMKRQIEAETKVKNWLQKIKVVKDLKIQDLKLSV